MKRNIWAQPFFFLSLFARIENLRFHCLSLGFVFMLSLCQAFEYWESYPLQHRRPQEISILIIIAQQQINQQAFSISASSPHCGPSARSTEQAFTKSPCESLSDAPLHEIWRTVIGAPTVMHSSFVRRRFVMKPLDNASHP